MPQADPSDRSERELAAGRGLPSGRRIWLQIGIGVLLLLSLVLANPLASHAKAAGVLLRLSDGASDKLGLRSFATVPIVRTSVALEVPGSSVSAYRYDPASGPSAFGLVLVHGVHYRGKDETRLVRFAESLARTGLSVMTPDVPSLADYRIDRAAIVEIGAAAHALRAQLGGERPVGVIGISFAGSLGLLAAADPTLGSDIGYVVTVGSYDDLGRICRFYATGVIERPDGSHVELHPHDYGPVVWVYAHAEDFFPADNVDEARATLRLWLHEEREPARLAASKLPDPSRKVLDAIFGGELGSLLGDLARSVDLHAGELELLSPHGHLDKLRVAVFALHGSDDHLIPASETLWLAHDLPAGMLAYALISKAVIHVELGEQASLLDQMQAVHFMAGVLAEARHPG